ncbi:hypothetical protein N7486_004989 [Penicillium sp. IBT 16267x]|nr:hypothetical protein N7486_004989 [Penicillium sp. IBT 16267x]
MRFVRIARFSSNSLAFVLASLRFRSTVSLSVSIVPGESSSLGILPDAIEETLARFLYDDIFVGEQVRRTNGIRDSVVTKTSFQEGSWVLVRNESGKNSRAHMLSRSLADEYCAIDPSPSTSNPPQEPKAKRPRRDALTNLLALRRYSRVSTSRSSAAVHFKATKNAEKAFKYECMCLD